MGLKAPELLIILAVVLLLFGGNRVPQLGSALGQAIRNFKRGFAGDETDAEQRAEGKTLATPTANTQATPTNVASSVRKDV